MVLGEAGRTQRDEKTGFIIKLLFSEVVAMCNLWNPDNQLEIKFTWTDKIIISMKQLMNNAKQYLLDRTFFWEDGSSRCDISWKDAVSHAFGDYRHWKKLFQMSGNIQEMPSFVYFQD